MYPDTPSDPPVRMLSLKSGPLAIRDVGQGPAVVAVHGLPGSGHDFRWLGRTLEPHLRFIRIDLPGFGASPAAPGEALQLEERALRVVEAAQYLGVDRYVVLGHSLGGPTAASAAISGAGSVAGLGLLASPGLTPHRPLRALPAGPLLLALRLPGVGGMVQRAMHRRFVRMGFRRATVAEVVRTVHCVYWLSFQQIRATVARLEVPTFIAWARDDRFIEPAITADLIAACPKGPRLPFDEGGHNIQKSRAVELAEALVPWVRSTLAA